MLVFFFLCSDNEIKNVNHLFLTVCVCPQWQSRCSIQYMCVARCKKKHFMFDGNHQQNSNYEITSKPHEPCLRKVCRTVSNRVSECGSVYESVSETAWETLIEQRMCWSVVLMEMAWHVKQTFKTQWHHYNNNNNKKAELSHSWGVLLMELPEAVVIFVQAQVNSALWTLEHSLSPTVWELPRTFNHWPVTHSISTDFLWWYGLGWASVLFLLVLFPYLLNDVPSSSWTSPCPACRGLVQPMFWRIANPSASSSGYSVTVTIKAIQQPAVCNDHIHKVKKELVVVLFGPVPVHYDPILAHSLDFFLCAV